MKSGLKTRICYPQSSHMYLDLIYFKHTNTRSWSKTKTLHWYIFLLKSLKCNSINIWSAYMHYKHNTMMLFIVAAVTKMFPALWSVAFKSSVEHTSRCCSSFSLLIQYRSIGFLRMKREGACNWTNPDLWPPSGGQNISWFIFCWDFEQFLVALLQLHSHESLWMAFSWCPIVCFFLSHFTIYVVVLGPIRGVWATLCSCFLFIFLSLGHPHSCASTCKGKT